MSIKVMNLVWERSANKGSALLLELAIADHAHDDGTGAWPSVETLARKTRLTPRNTQMLLRKLEASKEIETRLGEGPFGCNAYVISLKSLGGVKSFRGEKTRKRGVKSSAAGVKTGAGGVKSSAKNRVKSLHPNNKHQQEPSKNRQQQQPHAVVEINKRLDKLGIAEPTRSELAALKPDLAYLDGLIEHRKKHPNAGAGLYVVWVRGGITPPQAAKQKWFAGYEDLVNR